MTKDEKITDLAIELQVAIGLQHLATTNLAQLVRKARNVTDADWPDSVPEHLRTLVIDLREAIPCDDCLSAPCNCPNL